MHRVVVIVEEEEEWAELQEPDWVRGKFKVTELCQRGWDMMMATVSLPSR